MCETSISYTTLGHSYLSKQNNHCFAHKICFCPWNSMSFLTSSSPSIETCLPYTCQTERLISNTHLLHALGSYRKLQAALSVYHCTASRQIRVKNQHDDKGYWRWQDLSGWTCSFYKPSGACGCRVCLGVQVLLGPYSSPRRRPISKGSCHDDALRSRHCPPAVASPCVIRAGGPTSRHALSGCAPLGQHPATPQPSCLYAASLHSLAL
jgi:hypothetical protein